MLLAGIVVVCVLAVIGTACSTRDAAHPKAPAREVPVPSSSGVVIAQSGPAPLIPPPHAEVTGPSPDLPRGPAMPPDTVMLDTLVRQGKADVLP